MSSFYDSSKPDDIDKQAENKAEEIQSKSTVLLKQMLESFLNRPLKHDKIMKR